MCKKVGIAVGAVVLGLAVLMFLKPHSKLASLADWTWTSVTSAVDNSVPLDVEIDRINLDITRLSDDIKANFSKVAQDEVAISRLKKEIDTTRQNLVKDEAAILRMKKDVDSGVDPIVYAGERFSRDKVVTKLSQDWESFKSAEATLKAKEKLLEHRQAQVEANNAKIKEMAALQDKLRTEVARLKAELEVARLAQVRSQVQVDDTRLANIKSSIQDVQDRIDVMKKDAELQGNFANLPQIPVDKELKSASALDEISQRYGSNKVAADK
jgi:DNA repair exonuclease SbcCD ATPase subunit